MIDVDVVSLRKDFVRDLVAAGRIHDLALIAAFSEVPRHCFVPSFFMQTADVWWRAIDSRHPTYYSLVYSDVALTTQLKGGIEPDPGFGYVDGTGTSGSNPPGVMAAMLEALELSGTENVLEIGTGTGYNAALLSHRLGADHVTTVEIDPLTAELARRRLAVCGYDPNVVTGDGERGWHLEAPYRRILATCAVPRIPRAWLEQTCDGGVIVTGLWRDLGGGPLVRLVVDSGAARGRFLPVAGGFTPTCSVTPKMPALTVSEIWQKGETRDATVASSALRDAHSGMFIALQVPGAAWLATTSDGGTEQWWLFALDGSWSRLDETTMTVEQFGRRRLWDEIEAAHKYWCGLESPARDRIGLTVSRNGSHQFWLDTPSRQIWSTGTKKNK